MACKEEGIRNANTNSEKLIESCRGIESDEIDDRIRLYQKRRYSTVRSLPVVVGRALIPADGNLPTYRLRREGLENHQTCSPIHEAGGKRCGVASPDVPDRYRDRVH